jgi:hypothetical protein
VFSFSVLCYSSSIGEHREEIGLYLRRADTPTTTRIHRASNLVLHSFVQNYANALHQRAEVIVRNVLGQPRRQRVDSAVEKFIGVGELLALITCDAARRFDYALKASHFSVSMCVFVFHQK